MRAELEAKFNRATPAIVDHIIECRRSDTSKDEAIRQAAEMVQEGIWEPLSQEEREEMFCELCAVLMLKIAVDLDDANKKESEEDCEVEFPDDVPPEVVALIKKLMKAGHGSGAVLALKITPNKKH